MKAFNIIFLLCILLVACEKDESFYNGTIEKLEAEALPGAIRLTWTYPNDSSFVYAKMTYHDHGSDQEIVKLFSKYTDTLYIDGLLNKYGKYKFSFTPYDKNNVAGNTTYIEKECQKMPPWYVTVGEELITFTVDQLSTNAQEPSEGPIKNLIDDDLDSFFQSIWDKWSYPELIPSDAHYIAFDLKKEISAFRFQYWNRKKGGVRPQSINLYGSSDGKEWKLITTLTGLPSAEGSTYTSDTFLLESPISHIKYEVTSSTDAGATFFSMAEIKIYEIIRDLVDPEL